MLNLEKEIYNVLSTQDYSFNNVKIKEPFSYTKSDLTNPIVVVQRIYDKPDVTKSTNKEEYSIQTYQVSVLSRLQKNEDNETISAYNVVTMLSEEVVDYLYKRFLLERVGDFLVRPNEQDNTVMECVFRVTGEIDLTHEYLYTRR